MTDDIVTRLRKLGGEFIESPCHIAADEIERLRKQRNELAWAIAWFLQGGSRQKLKERFREYEDTL